MPRLDRESPMHNNLNIVIECDENTLDSDMI